MKCTIIAENKDIFCAVVNELTDWGHTYEVIPFLAAIHVFGTTKVAIEKFLDERHLNRNNLLVVEV